jgi:Lon protease-like protein
LQANRAKDAVLSDLKKSLASPDDLDKVPAMLEEMQRRHEATGAALSDHISMHCAQLRTGLDDMATALSETEVIKQRLREVRELCKKADVLGATEARHAGVMATVQVQLHVLLHLWFLARSTLCVVHDDDRLLQYIDTIVLC